MKMDLRKGDGIIMEENMAGISVFIIMFFVIAIVSMTIRQRQNGSITCKYDERQQIVRGNGFKYGFFATAVINVIGGLIMMFKVKSCIAPVTWIFFSTLAGIGVYVIYSILNDGYFGLNGFRVSLAWIWLIIAVTQVIAAVKTFSVQGFVVNGVLQEDASLNAMLAVFFIAVVVSMLIKKIIDRNGDRV